MPEGRPSERLFRNTGRAGQHAELPRAVPRGARMDRSDRVVRRPPPIASSSTGTAYRPILNPYQRGRRTMNQLTFENPVFVSYAIAAALMIVKMMSQAWITIFRMVKVN